MRFDQEDGQIWEQKDTHRERETGKIRKKTRRHKGREKRDAIESATMIRS